MPRKKNSKIDEAQALYEQGYKLVDIAGQLDVPPGTVRRWKSVYGWGDKANVRNDKTSVRKRGAPKGNKNALGRKGGGAPKGNQNARRWGFLSKYIPQETMELLGITGETSPLDLLWDQIQLAYAAIIRAQNINFVADRDDKTIEMTARGAEVQQAWDKQASFMIAQSRAQSELRSMIKQYDEMLHKNWEIATEEQRLRVELLRGKIDGGSDEGGVVIINDTIREKNK